MSSNEQKSATKPLEVEDIQVTFDGRTVLNSVSFSLEHGELTGLIGTNGAGKTTLLRVILGLQRPSKGSVLVGGRPLGRGNRSIGYVPQKVSLDPDLPLRARDMVQLGLDGHRYGLRRKASNQREAVDEMLSAVGADHLANSKVGRLSGGETQRILIAQALIGRPQLLLLDEPLANLDLTSAQEIVALLDRIRREEGIAILLSAHDINQLLPAMDRVVYLAEGRAVCGPTAEVIRSEVLSELYRHHVEVLHAAGRVIVVAGEPSTDHPTLPPAHDRRSSWS